MNARRSLIGLNLIIYRILSIYFFFFLHVDLNDSLKRNDNCWLLKSKVYISWIKNKILEINRLGKSSFLNSWIENKKNKSHTSLYMCCQSLVWIQSVILRYKLVWIPEGVWTIYKNTAHVYKCLYLDSRLDHSGLLIGLGLIWTHSMWTQSRFPRLLQINVGVTLILK